MPQSLGEVSGLLLDVGEHVSPADRDDDHVVGIQPGREHEARSSLWLLTVRFRGCGSAYPEVPSSAWRSQAALSAAAS